MQQEVKALKEVVERFGSMIEQLNYDYTIFRDWFDRVVSTDDFVKRVEETQVSQVEVDYTKLKLQNKDKGELKSMLDELDELENIAQPTLPKDFHNENNNNDIDDLLKDLFGEEDAKN